MKFILERRVKYCFTEQIIHGLLTAAGQKHFKKLSYDKLMTNTKIFNLRLDKNEIVKLSSTFPR